MKDQMTKLKYTQTANSIEVAIGGWKIEVYDVASLKDLVLCYKEEFSHAWPVEAAVTTLYVLLGFEFHCQQQGVSRVSYMDRLTYCRNLADTLGKPLARNSLLSLEGEEVSLGMIGADYAFEL